MYLAIAVLESNGNGASVSGAALQAGSVGGVVVKLQGHATRNVDMHVRARAA